MHTNFKHTYQCFSMHTNVCVYFSALFLSHRHILCIPSQYHDTQPNLFHVPAHACTTMQASMHTYKHTLHTPPDRQKHTLSHTVLNCKYNHQDCPLSLSLDCTDQRQPPPPPAFSSLANEATTSQNSLYNEGRRKKFPRTGSGVMMMTKHSSGPVLLLLLLLPGIKSYRRRRVREN